MYHACIYPTRTLCMCVYTLISLLLALKQPTERTPIPYHYIGCSQSFTARINAIGANILVTKSLSIFLTIQHIPLEVKFCGEISFCSFNVYCDIFYFWSYMQNTTLSLFLTCVLLSLMQLRFYLSIYLGIYIFYLGHSVHFSIGIFFLICFFFKCSFISSIHTQYLLNIFPFLFLEVGNSNNTS